MKNFIVYVVKYKKALEAFLAGDRIEAKIFIQ
jgi:hypothetical protein